MDSLRTRIERKSETSAGMNRQTAAACIRSWISRSLLAESKVRSCSAWSAELKSPASAAIAATNRRTPNRVAIPAVRPRRRSSSISWLVSSTLARLLGLGVPAGAIAGMRAVGGAYLRRVAHFAVSAVGHDRPGIAADRVASLVDDVFRRKRYVEAGGSGGGRPPSSS